MTKGNPPSRKVAGGTSRELAMKAARTTYRITTMPLQMWIRVWLIVLRLLSVTFATPKKIFNKFFTFMNRVVGREERSKLRSEIELVREYSLALQKEAQELHSRLAYYESDIKKAERMRENTFEEMREIRSEVGQIFDTLQSKVAQQKPRKVRSIKAPPPSIEPKLPDNSVQKWLTHTSLLISIGMLWYFLKGDFERSVERKLLMCLSLPMLWLYFNTTVQYRASMNSYFLASNIAWFITGFVCCSVLHPHGNSK